MNTLDTRDLIDERDNLSNDILQAWNDYQEENFNGEYGDCDNFDDVIQFAENLKDNGSVDFLTAWENEIREVKEINDLEDEISSSEWDYGLQLIDEDDFQEYCEDLVSDICSKFEIEEDEAEELLEEYRDEINDHYYSVDDSTVLKDLIRNTSSVEVRIPLYSNYDCINSHHFEGGYSYRESYFGDMVDVLNLNPAKVKKLLVENNVEVYGSFPNYKHREGKELVSYADFWQELENSSCGANLLVFTGLLNLQDLLDKDFKVVELTIPKGNNCGLFSSTYGGGSVLEMELQRDFKIKLDVPRKKGLTKYDTFDLLIDDANGYSIDSVYGMCRSFWKNEIKL